MLLLSFNDKHQQGVYKPLISLLWDKNVDFLPGALADFMLIELAVFLYLYLIRLSLHVVESQISHLGIISEQTSSRRPLPNIKQRKIRQAYHHVSKQQGRSNNWLCSTMDCFARRAG